MTLIIQRAAGRVPQPWRNGMGVQYEVTANGPLPEGWSWRLSTADILHDAPFSLYAGVVREFCVATGNGVILTIDGVSHHCGPHSITTFDGGSSIHASVIDGPTKDINLMVRHSSPPLHLAIHTAGDGFQGAEALLALGGGAKLFVDDESVELGELDAVLNVNQCAIVVSKGSIVSVR